MSQNITTGQAISAGIDNQEQASKETETHCHDHNGHGYSDDKKKYLARLRRIEGQARGIHRMVDEDVYCIDILTQISALTSALENVGLSLLKDHLDHCVVDAARKGGKEADDKIEEAMAAITRLVKS